MAKPETRRLLTELPLPLAQLAQRAANARAGLERHTAAFYLAEAGLKLAASGRVGRWVDAACEPGGKLARKLDGLALPSLGHWCGYFRDVSDALSKAEATRQTPLATPVKALSKVGKGWEAVPAFIEAAVAESIINPQVAKQARKAGLVGYFNLLVTYRNEVIGHGAQRGPKFYETFGQLILDATAEALDVPELFDGLRLVVAKLEMNAAGTRTTTVWKELMGLAGLPVDESAEGAEPGQLYLIDETIRVPLHPFVVYEEDDDGREHIGFLNRAVEKTTKSKDGGQAPASQVRRADFLDYVTGESLAAEACEALTSVLTRLRGEPVDASLVGAIAQTIGVAPAPTLPASPASQPKAAAGKTEPMPGAPAGGYSSDLADWKGRIVGAKYRITGKLGEGGMGAVFEAEHTELPRRLAVKVLRPELTASKEAVERFRREATEASAIGHAGIVHIEDLGRTEEGVVYMVMEHLDGSPVDELCQQGVVSIERAVDIISQALDALQAAHERGVVHRDLKPANLFLTKAGKVKVLDFGVAKAAAQDNVSLTKTGSVLGTPLYMSPEQIQDSASVDAATDVYAMGATLYELLTGQPVVTAETLHHVVAQVMTGDVQRDPRGLRGEVPEWLADVVEKALAHQPAQRFDSARAMKQALSQELGSTASAGPKVVDEPTLESAPTIVDEATLQSASAADGKRTVEAGPPEESQADDDESGRTLPAGELDIPAEKDEAATSAREAPVAAQSGPAWGKPVAIVAVAGVVALGAVLVAIGDDDDEATAGSQTTGALAATVAPASSLSSTAAASAATAGSATKPGPPPPGMVLIRGARFEMGSTESEIAKAKADCGEACKEAWFEREQRRGRVVQVSSFYLDQREVTNRRLATWLNTLKGLEVEKAGTRRVLEAAGRGLVELDAWNVKRDGDKLVAAKAENLPAYFVTWLGAQRFCEHEGKRLPTEAEWELAARGADGRRYPWGRQPPSCDGVTFGRRPGGQCEAQFDEHEAPFTESKSAGRVDRTPEGVLDLGGNLREWVLDPFDESKPTYQPCTPPCLDPLGDQTRPGADYRVVRGGGWPEVASLTRGARRSYHDEVGAGPDIGFRCAKPVGERKGHE